MERRAGAGKQRIARNHGGDSQCVIRLSAIPPQSLGQKASVHGFEGLPPRRRATSEGACSWWEMRGLGRPPSSVFRPLSSDYELLRYLYDALGIAPPIESRFDFASCSARQCKAQLAVADELL